MLRIGSENFVLAEARAQKRLSQSETAAIFRALCRKRSRAAKHESRSRNGSRSPGRAKSCGNTLRADICFPQRAPSVSATWPSQPKSTRRTRIESSRTCRSVDRVRFPIWMWRRSPRRPAPKTKRPLRDGDLSRTVCLRQGLWTEDLRTPPEQECSNGSLILLAVVLWRTFFGRDSRAFEDAHCSNETPESEDIALSRGHREMRPAAGLHAVAKTENRPPFPVASEEQSRDDHQTQRGRDRFWRCRFVRRESCQVSGIPEVLETFRGRANRGN
jgi:hypothetical protein